MSRLGASIDDLSGILGKIYELEEDLSDFDDLITQFGECDMCPHYCCEQRPKK